MATIRDVARESGVSVATVSYVLNNGPRAVSPAARQRVTEAMARLNYHPNSVARSLVRRRTHCLGVLLGAVEPEVVTNNYYAGVLSGIFAQARASGYDLRILTSHYVEAGEEHHLRAQQLDGAIVLVPLQGNDIASRLDAVGVPAVVVGASLGSQQPLTVDVDNALGTRLAMEHLLALGHRRIVYLMGSPQQSSVQQRRCAFEAILREWGIAPETQLTIGGDFNSAVAYAEIVRCLAQPQPPTAVFAGNDDLALQALKAAHALGLHVPQDLSIIGYDDSVLGPYLTPPLTTVRQPMRQIGEAAVRKLVKQIKGEKLTECVQLFTPELIVRGSTAEAPHA